MKKRLRNTLLEILLEHYPLTFHLLVFFFSYFRFAHNTHYRIEAVTTNNLVRGPIDTLKRKAAR